MANPPCANSRFIAKSIILLCYFSVDLPDDEIVEMHVILYPINGDVEHKYNKFPNKINSTSILILEHRNVHGKVYDYLRKTSWDEPDRSK